MSQRIRTVFFWLHLTAGLLAGVVVLIMSATGVLLTFEKQVIYYADTRQVDLTPPATGAALPIDEILARVRATGLVAEPSAVAIRRDPAAPDCPHRRPGRRRLRRSLHGPAARQRRRRRPRLLPIGHRLASLAGCQRRVPHDRPRRHRRIEPRLPFPGAFRRLHLDSTHVGVARRPPGDLVPRRPPRQGPRLQLAQHDRRVVGAAAGARGRVGRGHLVSVGKQPRLPDGRRGAAGAAWGRRGSPGSQAGRPPRPRGRAAPRRPTRRASQWRGPARTRRGAGGSRTVRERGPGHRAPAAPRLAGHDAPPAGVRRRAARVHDRRRRPRPAPVQGTLTVDRATGAALKWESFDAGSRGRQWRSLLRFAHTGEVGGLVGQAIAGLASLGGVVPRLHRLRVVAPPLRRVARPSASADRSRRGATSRVVLSRIVRPVSRTSSLPVPPS